jgi:D-alanine transaminase
MEPLASINGQRMPLGEAKVSVLDRGFLFGDSVYEVIRVYRGKPFLFDDHMRRLEASLAAIRIQGIPFDRLRQRILDTLALGFQEATIYIQITRGSAPRVHTFPANVQPLEFFYVSAFDDHYAHPREHGVRAITQPDVRWDRCDIKSTNLLGNVLAAQAAKEAGAYEAILFLPDGTLLEGTRTSCFGVLAGKLLTAPRSPNILPGITRKLILTLAQERKIPVEEHVLRVADLEKVTELFLTGTTSEVIPVIEVDGRRIGKGTPGGITRQLQDGYRDYVNRL